MAWRVERVAWRVDAFRFFLCATYLCTGRRVVEKQHFASERDVEEKGRRLSSPRVRFSSVRFGSKERKSAVSDCNARKEAGEGAGEAILSFPHVELTVQDNLGGPKVHGPPGNGSLRVREEVRRHARHRGLRE